jgi:hypothetical protein
MMTKLASFLAMSTSPSLCCLLLCTVSTFTCSCLNRGPGPLSARCQ